MCSAALGKRVRSRGMSIAWPVEYSRCTRSTSCIAIGMVSIASTSASRSSRAIVSTGKALIFARGLSLPSPRFRAGEQMKKQHAACLAISALLGCAPAFGQGWYIGIGVGQGSVDFDGAGPALTLDDKDTTVNARVGYQFHRNLAVELGYYRLGEYSVSAGIGDQRATASAEARSVGVSLVGILPLNRFDLYARLGYARSEVNAGAFTLGQGFSNAFGVDFDGRTRMRENEWFAGVGGRFHVTREVGVFAEFQRHDKLEVDSYFVGVDLRF
jgi:hypothetical protein